MGVVPGAAWVAGAGGGAQMAASRASTGVVWAAIGGNAVAERAPAIENSTLVGNTHGSLARLKLTLRLFSPHASTERRFRFSSTRFICRRAPSALPASVGSAVDRRYSFEVIR